MEDLNLSRQDKEQLLALLQEKENRIKYNKLSFLFPDEGELRRELYPKHIAFLNAGSKFTERAFIAGNQTGKTTTGIFEVVVHCTGRYPTWWEGKRFDRPVVFWVCGDRGEIIRDGLQGDLMGRVEPGTGLIPKDDLIDTTSLPGVPNGIGQYIIRHVSGGTSKIIIKTYQAGKNAFESAKVDGVMLDEECPMDIYVECQMRTITTNGIVFLTFTPDSGLTDTVLHFLDDKPRLGEANYPKFVAMVGWDDVPHLTTERKRQLLATIPPHMREVKTKGRPYLGAGAIYPIPEDDVFIKPFQIPEYWPKAYAFDPSWNRTAAVWGAYSQEEDCWYIYSEYCRGQTETPIHAEAIRSRGQWINGVIDPAAVGLGRGKDGVAFLEAYEQSGLNLTLANNSVDLGIEQVYSRLSTGRLKFFSTLSNLLYEYRIYRRDDKGRIVKKNDDCLDAVRYLIMSGASVMSVYREEHEWGEKNYNNYDSGRSQITGY